MVSYVHREKWTDEAATSLPPPKVDGVSKQSLHLSNAERITIDSAIFLPCGSLSALTEFDVTPRRTYLGRGWLRRPRSMGQIDWDAWALNQWRPSHGRLPLLRDQVMISLTFSLGRLLYPGCSSPPPPPTARTFAVANNTRDNCEEGLDLDVSYTKY